MSSLAPSGFYGFPVTDMNAKSSKLKFYSTWPQIYSVVSSDIITMTIIGSRYRCESCAGNKTKQNKNHKKAQKHSKSDHKFEKKLQNQAFLVIKKDKQLLERRNSSGAEDCT